MKKTEAFPSRYLKAEDLEEGDVTLTVADVQFEDFVDPQTKRPDRKPVMTFRERAAKPLVLNKTNWKTISQVLGSDDTDDWHGQQITLYATEVESFGEMTMGVRVRLRKPVVASVAKAATVTRAPVPDAQPFLQNQDVREQLRF